MYLTAKVKKNDNLCFWKFLFACLFIKYILTSMFPFDFSDHDIDDLEMQMVRYKPEGLDVLCRNTKFSRKELQIMYRGFKQVLFCSFFNYLVLLLAFFVFGIINCCKNLGNSFLNSLFLTLVFFSFFTVFYSLTIFTTIFRIIFFKKSFSLSI